jgi:hypothetical protein
MRIVYAVAVFGMVAFGQTQQRVFSLPAAAEKLVAKQ